MCLWPGSAVVIDPKGENAACTARYRATLPDHRVIVLDPFEESGVPDELHGAYNPLDLIDAATDEAITISGALQSAIVIRINDKYANWDESTQNMIETHPPH